MLTRMALRARLVTVILMVAVMAGGVYSLSKLQIQLFPDIDFPLVTVFTLYPEAGPQQVLEDVTKPIENAVQGAPGAVTVRSTSGPSIAQIVIEAEFGEPSTGSFSRRFPPIGRALKSRKKERII